LKTDYPTNTNDKKTNLDNARNNIKNNSINKLENVQKIVQKSINSSIAEKRKQ